MTDTTNTNNARTTDASTTGAPSAPEAAGPPRRYRARSGTARDHRITPRFTDAELSAIRAAADAAQMTVTGFCALAVLALARREPGQPDPTSEASGTGDGSGLTVQELAEMQRELREELHRRVREVAAVARDEPDFFARLALAGVRVRVRHSQRDPGEVTGYAVGLDGHTTASDDLV